MGLDRDLRAQLVCRDQIGEKAEADAGPLNAHQFVKEGEPVEPHPARPKKITAFECRVSGFGYAERARRCRPAAACRAPQRGRGRRASRESARTAHMAWRRRVRGRARPVRRTIRQRRRDIPPGAHGPRLCAGRRGELAGEMPDPARGAIDQHLAPEQQPALAQRVQCGRPATGNVAASASPTASGNAATAWVRQLTRSAQAPEAGCRQRACRALGPLPSAAAVSTHRRNPSPAATRLGLCTRASSRRGQRDRGHPHHHLVAVGTAQFNRFDRQFPRRGRI